MRKRLLIIATLLLIASACFAAGCVSDSGTGEEFSLTLKNEVMRELLYIGQEYSIDNIVEKESGATYTFEELFYFDDDFVRHDIAHSNGKFTQTEPYNVTAIVKGAKNGYSESKNVELKINFNSNAYFDAWLTSWVDPGVVRALSASKQYLTGEAETALRIQVMTSYNPIGDGVNIGNFASAYSEFGIKDWNNVVLAMDVYNDSDYELQIGFLLGTDKNIGTDNKITMRDKLLPHEWTKVYLSLRSLGFKTNILKSGHMAFKIRALDGIAPYDYTIYACNVELAEYSAEKFPTVETRTDLEVRSDLYDSLSGDELDKKLACYTSGDSNYSVTTDTKYTHGEDSTSSLKFTYHYDGFTGNPTPYRANLLLDETVLFDEFASDIEYWDNVFLSFWMKNDSGSNICLGLRFATKTAEKEEWKGYYSFTFDTYDGHNGISDKTGDWFFVKFSFASVAKALNFNYYTEAVSGLKLLLCTEISGLDVDEDGVFYIDDIKLYSEKSIATAQKEQYEASSGDEIDRKLAAYAWGDTEVYTSASDTTVAKEGTSSIKYTFTQNDSHTPHGNQYRAVFLNDDSNVLFNAYGADITDWSTAYVGFWIKTEGSDFPSNASVVAKFKTTQNGVEWKGNSSLYFVSYEYNVGFGGDWVYMEFALKDLIEKNKDGDYYTTGVTGFNIVLSAEIVSQNGVPVSFYIDGLKIYNGAALDSFDVQAKSKTSQQSCSVSINTNADYVKEGKSSLKYVTDTATRGKFLYYDGTFASDDLFGLTAKVFASEVYVGFWVKQDGLWEGENHVNAKVCMQNTQDGVTWKGVNFFDFDYNGNKDLANSADWQYVEFKVSDVLGSSTAYSQLYTESVTAYRIAVTFEAPIGSTFYIDGVRIYAKSTSDTFDERAANSAITSNEYCSVSINTEADYVKEGNSSLKYVTNTQARGKFLWYIGTFASDDLFGLTANVFENEVYVGFWLKQDGLWEGENHVNAKVCMQNTQDGVTWKGVNFFDFDYNGNKDLANSADWQYVEFKVSDVLGSNAAYTQLYTENVTKYWIAVTFEAPIGSTFYIDGVTISNQSSLSA